MLSMAARDLDRARWPRVLQDVGGTVLGGVGHSVVRQRPPHSMGVEP